jgi:hypothetical protein
MNYIATVSGGWILFSLAYYACPRYGGRHWFCGSVANLGGENRSEREKEEGVIVNGSKKESVGDKVRV